MFKKVFIYGIILLIPGLSNSYAISDTINQNIASTNLQTDFHSDSVCWSKRIADSEIRKGEKSWAIHLSPHSRWGYMEGLMYQAMLKLWKFTEDTSYFNLAEKYGDYIIEEDGRIKTYEKESYNIDNINAGKILFDLYTQSENEKYKKALDTLRNQMLTHPRTKEGGFWHKLKYPHQMWLDGIYMASPFLAQYAKEFNEPKLYDDVVNQILLISRHTYDSSRFLYYHGWDESREQLWADKETGHSANFWGRGIGWYAMAMVDVLDYLPEDHPGREKIIDNIRQLANGLNKYQDENTGLWYQVVNMSGRKGNYMESSASSMFTYFLFKAVRKGYIQKDYLQVAADGFNGIITELMKENPDGTWSLTNSCAVAGLGGKNNRDGSYEYYISERISDGDPKAYAPFIMAAIELEMLLKNR